MTPGCSFDIKLRLQLLSFSVAPSLHTDTNNLGFLEATFFGASADRRAHCSRPLGSVIWLLSRAPLINITFRFQPRLADANFPSPAAKLPSEPAQIRPHESRDFCLFVILHMYARTRALAWAGQVASLKQHGPLMCFVPCAVLPGDEHLTSIHLHPTEIHDDPPPLAILRVFGG